MNFYFATALCAFLLLPLYSETNDTLHSLDYKKRVKTIVIDPGHGGKDGGSGSLKNLEKDIALKIALKFGQMIKRYYPNVRVVYTRTKDVFLPLYQRAEVANSIHADLFISIHCNSLPASRSGVNGSETYVMGLNKANENLNLTKKENNVILLEKDYQSKYNGYDPNSPAGHIMLSMYQNTHIKQSIQFARMLQKQFVQRAKRKNRGVKQAGFAVLRATTMPSVLVETGFLSNKQEAAFLNSPKGQTDMAASLFLAFQNYQKAVESNANTSPNIQAGLYHTKKKIQKVPTTKQQVNAQIKSAIYAVQLGISDRLIEKTGLWRNVDDLRYDKIGKIYKYVTGSYPSLKEAVKAQKYWRNKGFKDAFTIAYYKGKRISLSQAKALNGR